MRKRRSAAVPLPKNAFRVSRGNGRFQYYWQERRGRPDHGPLHRLPDDARDPKFWEAAARLNAGMPADATPAPESVSGLIETYKGTARYKKLSDGSVETYAVAIDKIESAWGKLPAADLLPRHIYALMDDYSERPAMGNLIVRVLRNILKEGIRRGYMQTNAAREIDAMEEASVGAEPWPESAFAYVLANAPPILMRAAVLGRATGQRAVDMVKMRPRDRKDGGINVTIQKLGNVRHWLPLQSQAIAVIDRWRCEDMVQYLSIDRKPIGPDPLRAMWKAWKTDHPAVPADATLHDLRAMAVCDRRLAGVVHQQIADQLCMSLPMVVRYSKHIDKEANARAGMAVIEQGQNPELKRIWAAAETRKG